MSLCSECVCYVDGLNWDEAECSDCTHNPGLRDNFVLNRKVKKP